jgi:hypothetical protein
LATLACGCAIERAVSAKQKSSAEQKAAEPQVTAVDTHKHQTCDAPSVRDIALAFQNKLPTLAELDKLESAIELRRNNRLASLHFYRGQKLEEIGIRTDEIIDGECSEAPLAPEGAGNQEVALRRRRVEQRSPANEEHEVNTETRAQEASGSEARAESIEAGNSIPAGEASLFPSGGWLTSAERAIGSVF